MVYLDHHDLGEVQRASEFAAQLSSLVEAQLCGLVIESQIPEPAIVFVTEHLIREESDHQSAAKRAQDLFQAAANQGGTQSAHNFQGMYPRRTAGSSCRNRTYIRLFGRLRD